MQYRSLFVLAALFFPASALAAEGEKAESPKSEKSDSAVNVGAMAGIGFPRPVQLEAVVGIGRHVMLGAEYGFLPTITVGTVETHLWAASADLRVFPFGGSFYLGLRGGYQSLFASAAISAADIGSYSESVNVTSWFVNPRVGFLFRFEPLVLGIEAGVQFPIGPNVDRTSSATLAGIDIPVNADLTNTADRLGKAVVPTVDLLRVGLLF